MPIITFAVLTQPVIKIFKSLNCFECFLFLCKLDLNQPCIFFEVIQPMIIYLKYIIFEHFIKMRYGSINAMLNFLNQGSILSLLLLHIVLEGLPREY